MLELSDHVRVDLGDVVTSTLEPTADGAEWLVTRIEGWGAASQRGGRLEPTGANGVERDSSLYGGRILEVLGYVEAPTRAAAWAAYYRCTGALPGLLDGMVLTVHEEPAKSLRVVQDAPPEVEEPVDGCFSFTLKLLAEYPLKRATDPVDVEILAGDSETFTAAGNAAAEIELTTTGAGTVNLSAGGLTLTCGSVPSGTVLTSGPGFDNAEATVIGPSGADLFGAMVPGYEWPAVVPGLNTFVNAGTASVVVRYYPTYA